MEFDSKKLKAFHEEPTGIHMISWKLQTNETQDRNGQIIPNAVQVQLLNSPIIFLYTGMDSFLLHPSSNTIFKTECHTFFYNAMYSFAYLYSKS